MKPSRLYFSFWGFRLALLVAVVAGAWPLLAAPPASSASSAATNAPAEMPKSIFIYPASPEQGRDPFFPNSLRPYADNPAVAHKTEPAMTASLTLKAILGEGTNIFAIVNNHTFAPGESGEVRDDKDRQTHIRLVSINPQTQSAVVEAGGRTIELHLETKP